MLESRKELESVRFRIVNELWESTPVPTPERAEVLYAEWMRVERALVRMGE